LTRRRLGAVLALLLIILAASALYFRNRPSSSLIRSLAVLPLESLSGDASQDYFADGMTDELITDLGQISALHVISRTSVMSYKRVRKPLPQIARELNVDAVVEGTVLRSGDQVRITAQLIEASSDKHLWSASYEGELRETLALQSKVARSLSEI
jgi:TolB-like protein